MHALSMKELLIGVAPGGGHALTSLNFAIIYNIYIIVYTFQNLN